MVIATLPDRALRYGKQPFRYQPIALETVAKERIFLKGSKRVLLLQLLRLPGPQGRALATTGGYCHWKDEGGRNCGSHHLQEPSRQSQCFSCLSPGWQGPQRARQGRQGHPPGPFPPAGGHGCDGGGACGFCFGFCGRVGVQEKERAQGGATKKEQQLLDLKLVQFHQLQALNILIWKQLKHSKTLHVLSFIYLPFCNNQRAAIARNSTACPTKVSPQ